MKTGGSKHYFGLFKGNAALLGIKNLSSKKGNTFLRPPRKLPAHFPSLPLLPHCPHFLLSANSDTTYSSRMIHLKTPLAASAPSLHSCGLSSLSIPPPDPPAHYSVLVTMLLCWYSYVRP